MVAESLALFGVALVGLFLLGLGLTGFIRPAAASRFLLAFAGSLEAHCIELLLRVLAGIAFIQHAPATRWPDASAGVGWLLVVTTLLLALIPWRWHRKFAQRTVPQALRYLPLLAGASLILGAGVLVLALSGPHGSMV